MFVIMCLLSMWLNGRNLASTKWKKQIRNIGTTVI